MVATTIVRLGKRKTKKPCLLSKSDIAHLCHTRAMDASAKEAVRKPKGVMHCPGMGRTIYQSTCRDRQACMHLIEAIKTMCENREVRRAKEAGEDTV